MVYHNTMYNVYIRILKTHSILFKFDIRLFKYINVSLYKLVVTCSDNFSFQNNGIKSAHVEKQWFFWENNGVFFKAVFTRLHT